MNPTDILAQVMSLQSQVNDTLKNLALTVVKQQQRIKELEAQVPTSKTSEGE